MKDFPYFIDQRFTKRLYVVECLSPYGKLIHVNSFYSHHEAQSFLAKTSLFWYDENDFSVSKLELTIREVNLLNTPIYNINAIDFNSSSSLDELHSKIKNTYNEKFLAED